MAISPLLIPVIVALTLLLFLLASNHPPTTWKHLRNPIVEADSVEYTLEQFNVNDVKVPVVLGVMSRCPDALLCEGVFDEVLKEVGDKVNISFTFIAKFVCPFLFIPTMP